MRGVAIWLLCLGLAGCGRGGGTRLLFAGYTASREVYHGTIIPAFRRAWQAKTGQTLIIDESYLASGAQSRAIVGGFEADVAALSLEPDLDRLVAAGLVKHDYHQAPHRGVVATSLVAMAVRPGNPRHIVDFADLARPGVEVLLPNPRISGGAMWNAAALWGAALARTGRADAAEDFLRSVLANVSVMDRGARESLVTFEQGIGEVAVTYESEILAGRAAGRHYDEIVSEVGLIVECPAALVDTYVDEHGSRAAAEALIAFLHGPEAQAALVAHGFRPAEYAPVPGRPEPRRAWRVAERGGWTKLREQLFGDRGAWTRASEQAQAQGQRRK